MTSIGKLFTTLLFMVFSVMVHGQTIITGKILSEENEPMPNSNVVLYHSINNSFVKGSTTNEEGIFIISDVYPGEYRIVISYIGFETLEIQDIIIKNTDRKIDLANLFLKQKDFSLTDIVVKSNFGITTLSPGRITYSTSNLNSQKGGTGGDILKNMPSIFMGGSPNHNRDVRYRGLGNAYSQVLIDGKKSGISGNNRETVVDIIPAERIEYIEIVSNPTVDFQSDGINGLINIVTKKSKQPRFHGSISGGLDNNEGYNGDLSLYNSIENFDFGIQVSRLKRIIDKPKDVEKLNYKGNLFDGLQLQNEFEEKNFLNDWVKGNLTYHISNKTYLSLEPTFGNQKETKLKNLNTLAYKADNSFKENKGEKSDEVKNNKYNEYFAELNHSFDNYSELIMSFKYSPLIQLTEKSSQENKYNISGQLITSNPALKKENEEITTNDLVGQINYRFKLDGIGIIKTGYSYFLTDRNAEKQRLEFNYNTNSWNNRISGTDNFNISEKTHALYMDAKINTGNFNINPGLRIENSNINSESIVDKERNRSNYLLLLPVLNIIYNVDTTQYITFAFGRRIRRPGFNDMNPFIDLSDPLKIKYGNPALKPEIAWLYEIGYMKNFKDLNVGINLFYRDIKNVIQKVIEVNEEGLFVERPENFTSGYMAGLEFIAAIRVFDWWQLNGAYSNFDSKVMDSNFDGDVMKDQVKWTAKVLSDFRLPSEVNLQITGSYIGPKPSIFNYEEKIFFFDVGLTKKIKDYGEINLRVTDLFDTLKKIKNIRSGLSTSREIENTSGRIVTLTTTWNF